MKPYEPELWMCEQVEEAAGLPVGTIAEKLLREIVLGWLEGKPGVLGRWMEKHFVFEGEPEEKAQIASALYRLEGRWRVEEACEHARSVGMS